MRNIIFCGTLYIILLGCFTNNKMHIDHTRSHDVFVKVLPDTCIYYHKVLYQTAGEDWYKQNPLTIEIKNLSDQDYFFAARAFSSLIDGRNSDELEIQRGYEHIEGYPFLKTDSEYYFVPKQASRRIKITTSLFEIYSLHKGNVYTARLRYYISYQGKKNVFTGILNSDPFTFKICDE